MVCIPFPWFWSPLGYPGSQAALEKKVREKLERQVQINLIEFVFFFSAFFFFFQNLVECIGQNCALITITALAYHLHLVPLVVAFTFPFVTGVKHVCLPLYCDVAIMLRALAGPVREEGTGEAGAAGCSREKSAGEDRAAGVYLFACLFPVQVTCGTCCGGRVGQSSCV